MKIAIFYNLFFGGAKRVVFEHTKGLMELGHTVDIYTIDKSHDIFDPGKIASSEYRFTFSPKNLDIPIIKILIKDFYTFYILRKLHKKIAKRIDRANYDIALIHSDTYTQSPYILRFLKTKNLFFCLEPLRIGYEYSLRASNEFNFINKLYENITRMIRKNIDRKNVLSASNTTAISLFGREYMIAAYDLYPKISYLGVDTKMFKPMSLKKKNQILFIGQNTPLNGYGYAIEAIKLIPKNIRPELKIISLKNDQAQIYSENDLSKAYSDSLATLSLGTLDTFGLIPLESMACETPVIAFNSAGYRETILNGQTGFLVDFSSREIADKIVLLMSNPVIASKMGKEGRKWVKEKWTWKHQIKNLEKILIKASE